VSHWINDADGVTITGGEPFDQPSALIDLLHLLNQINGGDVLVYTGYSRTNIQNILEQVDGLIDALVSEPYDAKATDKLPLRGSDNQVLHLFTEKGIQRFEQFNRDSLASPTLDAMFDEDGVVWLCGIPKRNDLSRLRALLDFQGHHADFTQQDVKRKS
jgi:anaerobic ribonucleoside-triphosphate reductase activating protein